MRSIEDVRKSSRDSHRRLYAKRKAEDCCPRCGCSRAKIVVKSTPVKAEAPKATVVPAGGLARCRLCRREFPREELDLFGKCRGCRR